MANIQKDIFAIALKYNFILERETKHLIFKDERGNTVVVSRSPSDRRVLKNIEKDFKNAQRI